MVIRDNFDKETLFNQFKEEKLAFGFVVNDPILDELDKFIKDSKIKWLSNDAWNKEEFRKKLTQYYGVNQGLILFVRMGGLNYLEYYPMHLDD